MATLIFDLDGTLALTEHAALACLEEGLKDWGIQKPQSYFLQFVGVSWPQCFAQIKNDHQQLDVKAFGASLLKNYDKHLLKGVREVDGATEFMHWAHKSGDQLFVVSGSMIHQIELVLKGLKVRHLFSGIIGAEDAPHSKPHPAPYLTALDRYQIDRNKAWVFEDSTPGIVSAKGAQLRVIAVKANPELKQDTRLADLEISNYKSRSFDEWREILNKS